MLRSMCTGFVDVRLRHKLKLSESTRRHSASFRSTALTVDDSIGGSNTTSLGCHYPRMKMTLLAAVAMNPMPVDLLLTDGATFTLYRFQDRQLLEYENLSAQQAYNAVAVALKQHATPGNIDPSMTLVHRTITQKLMEEGVGPEALQAQTDSMGL